MKEVTGDLWDYHADGKIIVITTNGDLNKRGCAIMGKGIAFQAKMRFPNLPGDLGELIKTFGNNSYFIEELRLITFPVKHHFMQRADLKLIEKSCEQLVMTPKSLGNIYMPRPGCGNGQLTWASVKPILDRLLDDDRFVVVERFP